MDTVYVDYARHKLTCLLNDSDAPFYARSFQYLFDMLPAGTKIVTECTFDNFERSLRPHDIEAAKIAGVDFCVINPRQTPKMRREVTGVTEYLEDRAQKNDELDVQMIREIAYRTPGSVTTVNKPPSEEWVARFRLANTELRLLRNDILDDDDPRKNPRTQHQKDLLADQVTEILDLKRFDNNSRRGLFLGLTGVKKKHLSKTTVAGLAQAVKYAESRDEFEALCGLSVHGYPGMMRSEVMYHGWRRARKHMTLSEFRKECRRFYHELKEYRHKL